MLFLVGALTVAVAVALLRWSQPAYAPALVARPGAEAPAAQRARQQRRTALRTSRPARRAISATPVEPVIDWWPAEEATEAAGDREVLLSAQASDEPTLELWDAALGVEAIEEYLRLLQPVEGPVEPAAEEPVELVEESLVEEQSLAAWPDSSVEPAGALDDESRRDDEAWERLFGMLRPTEEALARARAAHATEHASQQSTVRTLLAEAPTATVPRQRSLEPAKTQTSRPVRRCGVCREPGHDRRRCPVAA